MIRFLVPLLTILLLPIPSWGQASAAHTELVTSVGLVRISYAVSRYYLLKKPEQPAGAIAYEPVLGSLRLSYYDSELLENRYLYTLEQEFTFLFQSSDESVLHVTNATHNTGFPYEPGTVIARKPGKVMVTVEAGGNKVEIPITVVELPIARGDNAQTVQAKLGKPDRILNTGTDDSPGSGEYWLFDKYPDLTLRMRDDSAVVETAHPRSPVVRAGVWSSFPKRESSPLYRDFHRDPRNLRGTRPYESQFRFSGRATKKSAPFVITAKRWKVTWKALPLDGKFGQFTIQVFRASDNKRVQAIANVKKAGGDESFIYADGEFYLDIVPVDCAYEILVEEVP